MGFELEWLAIKGATAEEACAALGADRTGTLADIYSAPLMGAALPSGYYLILVDYLTETVALHDSFVDDPGLQNEVLSFACHDGIMMTLLQSWTDGRRNWSLSRTDPTEPYEIEGPVPEPLPAIQDKLTTQQEEADRLGENVDYLYDMTADLGKALIGFKHDEELDPAIRFEVLRLRPDSRFGVPTRSGPARHGPPHGGSSRRPWWKFW